MKRFISLCVISVLIVTAHASQDNSKCNSADDQRIREAREEQQRERERIESAFRRQKEFEEKGGEVRGIQYSDETKFPKKD